MKTARYTVYFTIATIIAILFFWVYSEQQKRYDLQQALINANSQFYTEKNRLNQTISTQSQTIVTQRQALQANLLKTEELERNNIRLLQSLVRIKEHAANLETIIANFSEDVTIVTVTDTVAPDSILKYDYLRLPANFMFDDDWLTLVGSVTTTGIQFEPNGIFLLSKPQITIGFQNRHNNAIRNYFTKPKPVVIYQNENPYFSTTQMENIVITQKTKWYEKTWVKMISGIVIWETGRRLLTN